MNHHAGELDHQYDEEEEEKGKRYRIDLKITTAINVMILDTLYNAKQKCLHH